MLEERADASHLHSYASSTILPSCHAGPVAAMVKRSRADVQYGIDLLWTHQIRRENAFLHWQVQQLQDNIDKYTKEQGELRQIAEGAKVEAVKASAAVKSNLSDLPNFHDLQATLGRTTAVADLTARQTSDFSSRLVMLEKTWQDKTTDLGHRVDWNETRMNQIQAKCDETAASIQTRFDEAARLMASKLDEQSLEHLHIRIQTLEQQFSQQISSNDAPSHISESVEMPQVWHASRPHKSRPQTNDSPVQEVTEPEGEEHMLTMRNVEIRESTTDASLDLDANVTVPSYALQPRRPSSPRDSLQPILPSNPGELQNKNQLRTEIVALEQGRYHSHDRYLAEGQSLIDKVPEDQKRLVVEKFVEGLYSDIEREQCRTWLQLNGWQWDVITDFLLSGTPSAPVHTNRHKMTEPMSAIHCVSGQSSMAALEQTLPKRVRPIGAAHPQQDNLSLNEQPRRSARIAGSQHAYRSSQIDATKAPPAINFTQAREVPFSQNGDGSPAAAEQMPGDPLHGALDASKPESIDRSTPGKSTAHAQREFPSSAQTWSELDKGPSTPQPRSKIPQHALRAVQAGEDAGKARAYRKRQKQSDWPEDGSRRENSTTPDEIQLPDNSSLELKPRKKRKMARIHDPRSKLPPPEIPILSTSE